MPCATLVEGPIVCIVKRIQRYLVDNYALCRQRQRGNIATPPPRPQPSVIHTQTHSSVPCTRVLIHHTRLFLTIRSQGSCFWSQRTSFLPDHRTYSFDTSHLPCPLESGTSLKKCWSMGDINDPGDDGWVWYLQVTILPSSSHMRVGCGRAHGCETELSKRKGDSYFYPPPSFHLCILSKDEEKGRKKRKSSSGVQSPASSRLSPKMLDMVPSRICKVLPRNQEGDGMSLLCEFPAVMVMVATDSPNDTVS